MPIANILRIGDLRPKQVSAIKQKAQRLGVTPAAYIKQLIEDDLELDRETQRSSLDDLAKPFRTALQDVAASELDRRVATAQADHRQQIAKRKS
jgi:hypothetical protein